MGIFNCGGKVCTCNSECGGLVVRWRLYFLFGLYGMDIPDDFECFKEYVRIGLGACYLHEVVVVESWMLYTKFKKRPQLFRRTHSS